jgi:hypothetical protein
MSFIVGYYATSAGMKEVRDDTGSAKLLLGNSISMEFLHCLNSQSIY